MFSRKRAASGVGVEPPVKCQTQQLQIAETQLMVSIMNSLVFKWSDLLIKFRVPSLILSNRTVAVSSLQLLK